MHPSFHPDVDLACRFKVLGISAAQPFLFY